MTTTIPDLDPVTLEVIRMRLESIVEEMSIAMIRSSGSPTITESGDLNTALFDTEGRILAYSDFVQLHIGSGSVSVRNLIACIGDEPLAPGDAFISNDPHTAGSSHPPDTNVISPVFYEGKHIGWAQSQAHLVDIGGIAVGGFAPDAYDCYAEGLRLPPGVKLFEAGKPIESVRRVILNNVRVPDLLWNDVRSLVASNNTGIRRFCATVDEFGLDKFLRYTQASFALAEKLVRERVSKIADGEYEAEEWTEHNGHVDSLFRVHCKLTKKGDQLDFDFSESSDQTDGFINNSLGSTIGMTASAIIPLLAWDVPFNEGVMTACNVTTRKGSIVDPTIPAPISAGHLTTGARVARVVTKVLNEAFLASDSEFVRSRAQGGWADSWTGGVASGYEDDGTYFVLFNMDGGGMGGGAQTTGDGLDAAGMLTQLNGSLPDVEMNEMMYPVLYLWKHLSDGTAGHGAHRGGAGIDFAWTLHGTQKISQTVWSPTARVVTDGFAGGLPGGGGGHEVWRQTALPGLMGGTTRLDPGALAPESIDLLDICQQNVPMQAGDVFRQWIAGGGGFGDPLLRDSAAVAKDVADGYVAAEIGRSVYGVVIGLDGSVDADATRTARDAIRVARLDGRTPEYEVSATASAADSAPHPGAQGWICPASGAPLGEDWRATAILRTFPAAERLAEFGTRVRPGEPTNGRILLDEFYSAGCGTLLRSQIRIEQTETDTQ